MSTALAMDPYTQAQLDERFDPRTGQLKKRDLHVVFYSKAVLNKRETEAQGRPIHETVPYVRIQYPGDKNRVVDCPAAERTFLAPGMGGVRLNFIERFPDHWEAYQRNDQTQVHGTPLEVAPFLSVARCADIRAQNVHTLEQLSEVPDRALPQLGMGARELREKAIAYLKATDNRVLTREVERERDELAEKVAKLEAMVATLQAGDVASPEETMTVGELNDAEAGDEKHDDDTGQDLGPGTNFEEWDTEALHAFLTDLQRPAHKACNKATLVQKARAAVIELKKDQPE